MPKKKMSVEAALKDNENKWEASYAAHDASVAQAMVANDFVGVYWDGKIQSKSGVLGQITRVLPLVRRSRREALPL